MKSAKRWIAILVGTLFLFCSAGALAFAADQPFFHVTHEEAQEWFARWHAEAADWEEMINAYTEFENHDAQYCFDMEEDLRRVDSFRCNHYHSDDQAEHAEVFRQIGIMLSEEFPEDFYQAIEDQKDYQGTSASGLTELLVDEWSIWADFTQMEP